MRPPTFLRISNMPITEAQRERRKSHLGSSDMAAVLGVDPFRSAYDVYLEKTGQLEEAKTADYAEAGNMFEDGVLKYAENRLGKLIRNQYRIAEGFPLASNIDALVVSSGEPVECKTAGLFGPLVEHWGEPNTDELPDRVIIQCHVHMLCTEKKICHVPAFLGGRGFAMFHVLYDDEIASIVMDKSLEFWQDYVEAGVNPPDVLPSLKFAKRIKREPEKIIQIETQIVQNWLNAKEARLIQEKIEDEALAYLLARLGDAEGAQCELGIFTYLQQTRTGIDQPRLREEKPDIWKEYEKISRFRVARLKKPKPSKGAIL